jgi:ribonuclease P protein subunit RPR2
MVMPRGRKGRRTKSMINIASERIDILFNQAEEEALADNLQRSDRYVELARKIGMRYNVRVPGRYKRRYCKFCHSYLIPSKNSRVRVRGKRIVLSCESCGGVMRMPIIREREINPKKQ